MGEVTADLSIRLDGYAAGPDQRLEKPFGDLDHERLHSWVFEHGDDNGAEVAAVTEAAAYVMGRNVFGPGRGDWDLDWLSWWGEGVAIAGGAVTIHRYLATGRIDELRLHVVPFTVGAGSRIFDGVPPLDVEVISARHTPHVTHLTYRRS